MSGGQTRLGVFLKYWQPGTVKTRLASALGDDAAAELAKQFATCTLARFRSLGDEREAAVSPAERCGAVAALAGVGWQIVPQAAGDLGARMLRWFEDARREGIERAVLIGADSPTLPIDYVQQAFVALTTHDAVLGPAEDGGYYLIGLRRPLPKIFEQMAWSTPDVLAKTVERMRQASVEPVLLPPWHDVDTLEDLLRLSNELQMLDATQTPTNESAALLQLWEAVQAALEVLKR